MIDGFVIHCLYNNINKMKIGILFTEYKYNKTHSFYIRQIAHQIMITI